MKLEDLAAYGANVNEGMSRCMNNEEFYLRLVETVKAEPGFDKLAEGIAANDLDAAFEAAHSLKGVLGNLSITPLYDPMCELTELLRARTEMDYSEKLGVIQGKLEELRAL